MVTVVVSFALVFAAAIITVIDCGDDACSRGGRLQFVVALTGLAPALAMLLATLLGRGRPGLLFCAALLVWAVWVILVWQL